MQDSLERWINDRDRYAVEVDGTSKQNYHMFKKAEADLDVIGNQNSIALHRCGSYLLPLESSNEFISSGMKLSIVLDHFGAGPWPWVHGEVNILSPDHWKNTI